MATQLISLTYSNKASKDSLAAGDLLFKILCNLVIFCVMVLSMDRGKTSASLGKYTLPVNGVSDPRGVA